MCQKYTKIICINSSKFKGFIEVLYLMLHKYLSLEVFRTIQSKNHIQHMKMLFHRTFVLADHDEEKALN
jgi:hypothetical protein